MRKLIGPTIRSAHVGWIRCASIASGNKKGQGVTTLPFLFKTAEFTIQVQQKKKYSSTRI